MWNGELSSAARNILIQHAIQGDISELQQATVKWLAYSRIPAIDPKILFNLLQSLEVLWCTETLSKEEVSACNLNSSRKNVKSLVASSVYSLHNV